MIANTVIRPVNTKFVANELAKILADEYVLYTKTKNAHWNIEGRNFYNKNKFLKFQSEELDGIMDDVADRIRSCGHYTFGTLKSFLALTHLKEVNRERNDGNGFLNELLADHESIIIYCRGNFLRFEEDLDDIDTGAFFTRLIESHEKMAWMIRAQLK